MRSWDPEGKFADIEVPTQYPYEHHFIEEITQVQIWLKCTHCGAQTRWGWNQLDQLQGYERKHALGHGGRPKT